MPGRRGASDERALAGEPTRPGRRFTVRTRLIAAIVIPVLMVCVGATSRVVERHRDVDRADRALEVLDRLVLLTELRSALFAEWLAAELQIPARRPSAEVLARTEFGSVLLDDPDRLPRRTDAALAALDPEDRTFTQADLDTLRAARDEWATTIEGISTRLGPLYDSVVTRQLAVADPLRIAILRIGDPGLVAAGTAFERAIRLPGTAGEVLRSLTDLYLAEPDRRPALQSEVAAAASSYLEVAERFERSVLDPDLQDRTRLVDAPPMPAALAEAVDVALAGDLTDPGRRPTEPLWIAEALLAGIDWLVEIDSVPGQAAVVVRDEARRVVDEEHASEQRLLALTLAIIVSSFAVVWALARSISVPVRRLTDQARQIGGGNLAVDPLPERGPSDVAAASAAMNDVLDNLALVREKALALREGRLTDPALAAPLPGPLGAEIDRAASQFIDTLIERESIEAQLAHEATHDALTGMLNRAGLFAAVQTWDLTGERPHAVVFVDLSDFKRVNESHGHGGGDRVLQIVADRIVAAARPGDLVGRWGADEFVVLSPDRTADEAVTLARALVESVSRPMFLDGAAVRVGACAGVATSELPTGAATGDLIRDADLAAYHAKQSGAGSVVVFDEQLGQKIREREEIGAALAHALRSSATTQLFVVFQPIVATRGGRLAGIETLVRWRHPERGLLPPDQFVPTAERSGLVADLDRWTLRAALAQLAAWAHVVPDGVPISVNVSARTLRQADYLDFVVAELERQGVQPNRLVLEITETALLTDLDAVSGQLERLRQSGVSVAIDDFGTGYTSIAQLRALPIDELKIDMSFVREIEASDNAELVRMIADMARHLQIRTVAEGVETLRQHQVLEALGCDFVQGYLFSRPVPAEEFAERVRRWNSAPEPEAPSPSAP